MILGSNSVHVISDGTMMLDGGSVFGQIPRSTWEQHMKPDRKNRIRMGINCLLVQTPQMNVLVDTGVGTKRSDKLKDTHNLNGNKLLKGLRKLGMSAGDIDAVVITHLHYDHVGGCTKLDRSGNAVLAFPKAEYMVQKESWEEATAPNERGEASYYSDDFMPIQENGALKLLNGDTEIAPGVYTRLTNGHAGGHQVVMVEAGSDRYAYAGDLIPTPFHIPLKSISATDDSPNHTLEHQREILRLAIDEGWMLVFGHGHPYQAGYLEHRNGKPQLRPVEV